MKKVISLLLTCALLFGCMVFAGAEAVDAGTAVVTVDVGTDIETYTLSIPADEGITIDAEDRIGTFMVSLSDVNLQWHTQITVYMSSENGDATGANLVNAETQKKVHYTITNNTMNGFTYSANNLEGFPVADYSATDSENKWAECEIAIEIDGKYPGPGTYTDTLTFSVELQGQA